MITKQRVLKQVNFLPTENVVAVQWADQIVEDGVVLSESYFRRAYSQEEKAAFIAEVENGAAHAAVFGW